MKVAFLRSNGAGVESLFSRAVKWWTRGPFWHCELIVDQFGGHASVMSSSLSDGGVRASVIRLNDDWEVVDVPATPEQRERALLWFAAHNGEPYDIRGLFGFVVRRIKGEKGKWFCSESIAAAFGYEDPWRFDPNTLYTMLSRDSEAYSTEGLTA
jgi:uncharacterized protein YycO